MVEINNIPTEKDEQIITTANKIAKLMKVPDFSHKDIDIAHRLSNEEDAGIIVKFMSRSSRDNFFKCKKRTERENG